MKKKTFGLFFVILLLFTFTACGTSKEKSNKENDDIAESDKIKSITEFKTEVKNLGVTFDEVQLVAISVGAKEALRLTSGQSKLDIYFFDETTDDYKKAYQSQKIISYGTDEQKAIVKNGYAVVIPNDYPEYDEIIKLVNRLR